MKREWTYAILLVISMGLSAVWVATLPGCATTTPEELQAAKNTAQILAEELGNTRAELSYTEDPVVRAKLQKAIDDAEPYVKRINAVIQEAETGGDMAWGLLETALTVAAGFFPGIGLAVPLIRSVRRSTKRIMVAVDDGGGVVNGEAALKSLVKDPKALKLYTTLKNGA